MTVYDLVYTPADTPLIIAARKAGCITIPGTEMFVRQACAQFRCFTGIEVLTGDCAGVCYMNGSNWFFPCAGLGIGLEGGVPDEYLWQ